MKQIESNRPTVDAAGLFSLSIKFLLHICQYFFQLYERHLTETQGGFCPSEPGRRTIYRLSNEFCQESWRWPFFIRKGIITGTNPANSLIYFP
jgi:hypothetical protein